MTFRLVVINLMESWWILVCLLFGIQSIGFASLNQAITKQCMPIISANYRYHSLDDSVTFDGWWRWIGRLFDKDFWKGTFSADINSRYSEVIGSSFGELSCLERSLGPLEDCGPSPGNAQNDACMFILAFYWSWNFPHAITRRHLLCLWFLAHFENILDISCVESAWKSALSWIRGVRFMSFRRSRINWSLDWWRPSEFNSICGGSNAAKCWSWW